MKLTTQTLPLFLLLLLIGSSCRKSPGTDAPFVKADSASLLLQPIIGSIDSFTIQSNVAWQIAVTPSSASSWLIVSESSGNGAKKVYATVISTNAGSSGPSASITITAPGVQAVTIAVNQQNFQQSVLWNRNFGGGETDLLSETILAPDGSYVSVGYSRSIDGDIIGQKGRDDIWMVKADGSGNKLWSKNFGGINDEQGSALVATADSGYLIVGSTFSNNGDALGNHGRQDAIVIKIDGVGNKQWSKCFGGTNDDAATDVVSLPGNKYVITAGTLSSDGDVRQNKGVHDGWVFSIDGTGNLLWENSFGGSGHESFYKLVATSDGSCILAGHTASSDGDINRSRGGADAWLMKINAAGSKVWSKTFGGAKMEFSAGILADIDGGFVLTGQP